MPLEAWRSLLCVYTIVIGLVANKSYLNDWKIIVFCSKKRPRKKTRLLWNYAFSNLQSFYVVSFLLEMKLGERFKTCWIFHFLRQDESLVDDRWFSHTEHAKKERRKVGMNVVCLEVDRFSPLCIKWGRRQVFSQPLSLLKKKQSGLKQVFLLASDFKIHKYVAYLIILSVRVNVRSIINQKRACSSSSELVMQN